MTDSKITELTALTAVDDADVLAIVDDPGGTPVTKKITVANLIANHTGDTAGAHAATAISFSPQGTIVATNVQTAIQEVRDEAMGLTASGCEVSRASQNITTGTDTAISFTDADTSDTDSYHNPSSNASRIIAPFTGRYLVTATLNHESDTSTAGARRAYLDKNAAGTHDLAKTLASTAQLAGTGAGTGNVNLVWSGRLTATDYIEFFYLQSSGTTRTIIARASMEYLGA